MMSDKINVPMLILKKIFAGLAILFCVSFLAYILLGLMPGDPVDLMAAGNPTMTASDLARLRELYGLDRPLVERYGAWLMQIFSGDFGYSRLYSRPVGEVIMPALTNSLLLILSSMILALLIAVPLAVQAARHQGGRIDYWVNLFCFAGVSIPPFWLAILLIYIFAVSTGWLPAGGMARDGASLVTQISYFILPVLALTLATVGSYIRHIRAALVQVISQDFIRTARAIGATESEIYKYHLPRHVMAPIVTVLMMDLGVLFSGALITETVFGVHGMGKLLYDSMMGNDFNLALVILMVLTVMIFLANQFADLIYRWLDPRISSGENQ